MRIAVVHNQPSGGARRALHGFCAQWRDRHEIDVFTLETADDKWLDDHDVAANVYRYPLRRRRPVRMGLYLNDARRDRDLRDLVTTYEAIARRVDAGGFDVVLVDVCRFALVPPAVGALRTPAVVYAHNGPARLENGTWDSASSTWARMRSSWHAPLERAYERRLAALQAASVRAARRVVANSEHTAARVRRAYGVDAAVCPPGVDIPALSEEPREDFVLSVGEIEPRKGFAFVVDALGRVDPRIRPALHIAANRANPIEHERLLARARARAVDLRITLDPPADVLWSLYRRASLFVYGAHHEALGLAPLEAMACATPVIAVAEGGVLETVVDGGTGVLLPREPGRIAGAIERLLEDRFRCAQLGDAARAHVERSWAWPVRAAALERVLAATACPHVRAS